MAGPVEDVAAAEKDALLPLWTVLGIVTGALLISLLVKLYTVLTVGKCSSNVDMAGKTVIITGANTGIGKETARELARRNARVILACRNPVKAKEAADDIHASTGRSVVLMQLDLCSLNSVRQFARHVLATEPRLDVLILNAGMMSPPNREETEDGFEATFQANHLGHFLLTHLLLDLLKKSKPSRVVVVGSCGQVAGRLNTEDLSFGRYWFPLLNYCTTKQCNMLFTVELSRKLKGSADWAKEPFEPNWNKVSAATSSPRHEMQAQRERCAPEEAISNLPSPNADSQGGFAIDSHPADTKLRKRQSSVTVNCCHPGFVRSEIAVRSSDIQTWLFNLLLNFYGKSVKEGAETTVYLAVSEEVENVSGKYFKDCAPTFAVPWATNAVAAKKLYEESIRMTQIKEVI
ncbi:retinol dehydrogenase 11-like isoform X1 [Dermacentor andersoni]|uniref:retinol dehydrogenase 11-like isoform X1 n=1 Tax=Dermacentor andersoni TaxID=34620 RepID=UPI002155059F|nr:retinol dehydrogenase 11-like isoform X1 [Dermacentor andersoni]